MTMRRPHREDPVSAAVHLLMFHANEEVWPEDVPGQRRVVRAARRQVHPDKTGSREQWDALEEAADLLGLNDSNRRRR